MKNSSPYAKDKSVHGLCAEGLGNLRHHHFVTFEEGILFPHKFLFILIFSVFLKQNNPEEPDDEPSPKLFSKGKISFSINVSGFLFLIT